MTTRAGDERQQVRRMLAGDERAFDAFFEAQFQPLYRFALTRLGGDADIAEEVVQRSLCIAVDKLHTFRGEAALFTWLCTICRREISAYFKRTHRRPLEVELAEDRPEVRAALDSLVADADGPEELAHRAEIARLVHVALDHLPPHYGNALEWKYIHGLSVNEVARRLNTGPKAAESLLTRARGAFRDAFGAVSGGGPAWQLGPGNTGRGTP